MKRSLMPRRTTRCIPSWGCLLLLGQRLDLFNVFYFVRFGIFTQKSSSGFLHHSMMHINLNKNCKMKELFPSISTQNTFQSCSLRIFTTYSSQGVTSYSHLKITDLPKHNSKLLLIQDLYQHWLVALTVHFKPCFC